MSNRPRNVDSGRRDSIGRRIMVADNAGCAGRSDAPAPTETSIDKIGRLDSEIEAIHADIGAIQRSAFDSYADFRAACAPLDDQMLALKAERRSVIANIKADPATAESWHRRNLERIQQLRAALRPLIPSSSQSVEERADYDRLAEQFRTASSRSGESENAYRESLNLESPNAFWRDPAYAWATDPDSEWRDDPDDEVYLYVKASAYAAAAAATADRTLRRRFDDAARACATGRFGDGYAQPCVSCGEPMSSYDDEVYSCGRCR